MEKGRKQAREDGRGSRQKERMVFKMEVWEKSMRRLLEIL
jgi:hypothetical protein